jgi:hypothetical protein
MRSFPVEKEIEIYYKDERSCITYLLEHGILYKREPCICCHIGTMKRYLSKITIWKCNNYKSKHKISVYYDSFFAKSRIPSHDLLRIAYKWLSGQRYTGILQQIGHLSGTVSATIRFCRKLIASNMVE